MDTMGLDRCCLGRGLWNGRNVREAVALRESRAAHPLRILQRVGIPHCRRGFSLCRPQSHPFAENAKGWAARQQSKWRVEESNAGCVYEKS
jgi:hypothetical protein